MPGQAELLKSLAKTAQQNFLSARRVELLLWLPSLLQKEPQKGLREGLGGGGHIFFLCNFKSIVISH